LFCRGALQQVAASERSEQGRIREGPVGSNALLGGAPRVEGIVGALVRWGVTATKLATARERVRRTTREALHKWSSRCDIE
jgi:hypothetical protein